MYETNATAAINRSRVVDASKVGPSSFILEIDTSIFYRSRRYADLLQEHHRNQDSVSESQDGSDIGYYSERGESTVRNPPLSSANSNQTDDYAKLQDLWQYYSDDDESDRDDSMSPHRKKFYCSMHKSQRNPNLIILELESYNRLAEVAYDKFFFGLNTLIHTFETAKDITELCNLAVGYVQHVTWYERVMMYQFDEDWNGVVIGALSHILALVCFLILSHANGTLLAAENLAADSNAESYMGIHFPATDIPKQARWSFFSLI